MSHAAMLQPVTPHASTFRGPGPASPARTVATSRATSHPAVHLHAGRRHAIDERVQVLQVIVVGVLFLSIVALVSLPQLRGISQAFGLLPLWLLGMPLASLLALSVARVVDAGLLDRRSPVPSVASRRRDAGGMQARRWAVAPPRRRGLARAA